MRLVTLILVCWLAGCAEQSMSLNTCEVPQRSETFFVGDPISDWNDGSRRLVVFVHGFTGNSVSSWTNEECEKLYELVRRGSAYEDYPFDILTVGFRSRVVEEGQDLPQIADTISSQLRDRGVWRDYDDVVLLGHSMGGVIVASIVGENIQDGREQQKLRTAGAILLGAPVEGSDVANLVSWIVDNSLLADLRDDQFNSDLREIRQNWNAHFDLRAREDGKSGSRKRFFAFAAYEGMKTNGVWVVPETQVGERYTEEPRGLNGQDHRQIAAPQSENAEVLVWIDAKLYQIFEGRRNREESKDHSNTMLATCEGSNCPSFSSDVCIGLGYSYGFYSRYGPNEINDSKRFYFDCYGPPMPRLSEKITVRISDSIADVCKRTGCKTQFVVPQCVAKGYISGVLMTASSSRNIAIIRCHD